MLIKRITFCLLIWFCWEQFPSFAQVNPTLETTDHLCPADLANPINSILHRPAFYRSRWGILVETLNSGETLYSHNSHGYFLPASTLKLFTTAAALQVLGPNFRVRTSVYQGEAGQFYIVGRGDPSLNIEQLENLAQQLKIRGITEIKTLIADDTYFQGDLVNQNWEWEDVQAGYGAPINSLIFNQNALDLKLFPQAVGQPLRVEWIDPSLASQWQIENETLTVSREQPEFVWVGRDFEQPVIRVRAHLREGSEPEPFFVAITNPTERFLGKFKEILERNGITVMNTEINPLPSAGNWQEVAKIESPPLVELITETNQISNNLYAEALLRILGATRPGTGDTATLGLKVVESALTRLGVDPSSYVLKDGAGLSRHNLVSPEALVQTLRGMAQAPIFPERLASVYRASLPVAAVSGTLKGRFQGTALAGSLQAKTGTLSGMSALAGYLEVPGYDTLIFSVIVNQSAESASVLRRAIDDIVLLLARVGSCTEN